MQAPTELQQNLLNTQNSLFAFMRQQEQVQAQLQATTFTVRHKLTTLKAIEEIPTAPLYRAIGKAFYAAERDEVVETIAKEVEKGDQEIGVLKNTQQYVEKKAKETEDKLKELLELAKAEQQ